MKMKVDVRLVKGNTGKLKSELNNTITKYENELTQIRNLINKSKGDSVDALNDIIQAQLDALKETKRMYRKVLVFLENSAEAIQRKDNEIKNMIKH